MQISGLKITAVLCTVVLFFFACGKRQQRNVVSFDSSQQITMQGHALQGDSILWSEGIVIMDSLLINLNDKMDTVFNVYRLSDFSFLGSCGVRGEGPDDISFFNSRSWGLFGHGLFYADMNKCNLGAIRFEKGKPIFFVEKRITIPRPGAINGMAVSIDTSVMYFSSYCQENEFVRVNKEDPAHPVPIGVYPEYISGDIPAVNIMSVYLKHLSYNSQRRLYVALYEYLPLLRVFDEQGRIIAESILEGWESRQFEAPYFFPAEDNIRCYLSVCSDENYIYGLYIGQKAPDLEEKGRENPLDVRFSVHVWDWEGRPVADLHPDRLLMKIAVQDGVLYGINTFVSDTVYTYKLDLHS